MLMTVLVDSYPVNVLSALVNLLGLKPGRQLITYSESNALKTKYTTFLNYSYGRSIYICSEYSYISEYEL